MLYNAQNYPSVGKGTCRDTDKSPCEGDEETIKLMAETLDDVKPDFVVFSGLYRRCSFHFTNNTPSWRST